MVCGDPGGKLVDRYLDKIIEMHSDCILLPLGDSTGLHLGSNSRNPYRHARYSNDPPSSQGPDDRCCYPRKDARSM